MFIINQNYLGRVGTRDDTLKQFGYRSILIVNVNLKI